ncbi:serine hydrolase [Ruegeria pomeroyi]|nr:serine hydrolase [Ruegeria pomeroyi]
MTALFLIVGVGGTAVAQDAYPIPDDLTPVSEWADGFSAEDSRRFIENYNAKSFVIGDDIGTYGFLNLSEVLPVSKVFRQGDVADLEVDIDPSIGTFKVDGPLGNLTLEEAMADERSRMQGIIVLKQGKIVYEKYPGMPRNANHVWMSSTKVVTGLIMHMLEQDGLLSLEDDVTDYIPEYKGTDWEGITLANILHQQSGMDLVENAANIANPKMPVARAYAFAFSPKGATPDPSIFAIMGEVKRYREPGTQFDYSTFNTHILGVVIEKVTGSKFTDVFSERIWSMAGMEGDGEMATTPIGEPLNGGVFAARLRDKARFALLFTPSWSTVSETRVVNDAYFEKVYGSGNSAAFFNPESDMGSRMLRDFDDAPTHASYQWDAVFEDGDLYKSGKNGQCIYISPSNDMAVVWFSNTYDNSPWLPIYARAIVKETSQ